MAKDIDKLSRFEIAVLDRKHTDAELKEAINGLGDIAFVTKGGEDKRPSKTGLMVQINIKTKKAFGVSCDEIDKIGDVLLSNAIRNLKEDLRYVIQDFIQQFQGDEDEYEAFKERLYAVIWNARRHYDERLMLLGRVGPICTQTMVGGADE